MLLLRDGKAQDVRRSWWHTKNLGEQDRHLKKICQLPFSFVLVPCKELQSYTGG